MRITDDILINGTGRLTHQEVTEFLHSEILSASDSTEKHLRMTQRLMTLRLESQRERYNDPWFTPRLIVGSKVTGKAYKVTYDDATGFYWVAPHESAPSRASLGSNLRF